MPATDPSPPRRGGGNLRQGPACQAAGRELFDRYIRPLQNRGVTQERIAAVLNAAGVRAIRGGVWSRVQVTQLISRVGKIAKS